MGEITHLDGLSRSGTNWPPGVIYEIMGTAIIRSSNCEGVYLMAAMKPRTGDGPMEVTKEGRSLIMRVPLEGGGRLVVELNADEASRLKDCLVGVTG